MMRITLDTSGLDKMIKEASKKLDSVPYWVANEIVNTVKDRITKDKSYNDSPWVKSIRNSNTLIKSGDMRDSVKIASASKDEIIVEIATKYATIHNEGGTIVITEQMRKYFWSQYYKTNDLYWKNLAMHRGNTITIPKRQMVGDDDKKMIENIETLLKKIIEE